MVAVSLPPQLEEDLSKLRARKHDVSAERDPPTDSRIYIVFENYPLPEGWNRKTTRLLVISDVSYPNSKLDMFWVDPDLRLCDGRQPQAGENIETHLNERWQRFSWHVKKWNPAVDNLITYLDTVNVRLRQLQ